MESNKKGNVSYTTNKTNPTRAFTANDKPVFKNHPGGVIWVFENGKITENIGLMDEREKELILKITKIADIFSIRIPSEKMMYINIIDADNWLSVGNQIIEMLEEFQKE